MNKSYTEGRNFNTVQQTKTLINRSTIEEGTMFGNNERIMINEEKSVNQSSSFVNPNGFAQTTVDSEDNFSPPIDMRISKTVVTKDTGIVKDTQNSEYQSIEQYTINNVQQTMESESNSVVTTSVKRITVN